MVANPVATARAVALERSWERFAASRPAAAIAFGWGLAEATLFFLVPDIWIGLVALFDWRAGLRAAGWALAGALVGGALMYGVGARVEPERSARLLDAVPAVSPAMIERVEEEMRAHGPASMLLGPVRGTPYKIYARTAGVQRMSLPGVLLWTVPARALRFVPVALAVALAGWLARRWVGPRPGWFVGLYLTAWAAFYAAYFRAHGF
jgi:membrane protein YqaA with SNARE-associated domain